MRKDTEESRELINQGATFAMATIETQRELLNRVLRQTGIDTYTELAKALSVSRQAISQFRRGGPISNDVAVRIAKLGGESFEYVFAVTQYNKEAQADRVNKATLAVFEKMARDFRRKKD